MKDTELFEHASIQELKKGYLEDEHCYTCLLCNKTIEKGIIYPHNNQLFEAKKMMQTHINDEHKSVFDYLIGLNKKMTGLTEHQSNLLRLFYAGKTDGEIQKELEIGSASTIRQLCIKGKRATSKDLFSHDGIIKGKRYSNFRICTYSLNCNDGR